ncbi:DUF2213 domain-containing protein [Pseudomonas aeruginosa]|uniref:DUF2213 domain-containing protein n=1 Tax=Pseudomonas aeruginosa TaxID=287 RepID=UPI0023E28F8C|nr:DUF2213 domain-containing protein [Pseudomonas aeruginosa]
MTKSKRKIDENGYMTIEGCPISSYGVFQYSAGQLGLPGDPTRIVNVYRPESAVSDPEYIESLKNLPLIDEHEMLSGFDDDDDSVAPEDKGVEGIITSNAYYEAPWARGDIRIYSRNMQNQLERGKEDLSLGYSCRYTEQPGIWNGTPYEVVQDKMRGNHIALVKEGRVPGARVLDGLCFDHLSFDFRPSDEGNEMSLKKAKRKPPVQRVGQAADSAVEELRTLWPKLSASVQKFLGFRLTAGRATRGFDAFQVHVERQSFLALRAADVQLFHAVNSDFSRVHSSVIERTNHGAKTLVEAIFSSNVAIETANCSILRVLLCHFRKFLAVILALTTIVAGGLRAAEAALLLQTLDDILTFAMLFVCPFGYRSLQSSQNGFDLRDQFGDFAFTGHFGCGAFLMLRLDGGHGRIDNGRLLFLLFVVLLGAFQSRMLGQVLAVGRFGRRLPGSQL